MKKLSKIVLIIVLGLMIVSTLYLAVGDPGLSISDISSNYDNLSTKSAFYKYAKDEWVDYIEKVREEQQSVGTSGQGGASSSTTISENLNGDLREVAKTVANAIIDSANGGSTYHNGSTKTTCGSGSYPGPHYYSTGDSKTYTVQYGSNIVSLKYRCCTTMVNGVAYLSGNTDYVALISDGAYKCSTIISNHATDSHFRKVTSDMKFSDLKAGDVLLKSTHTEIIVYVDDSYVYTANGGSCNGLIKTAQDGYARKLALNSPVTGDGWTYVVQY